MSTRSLRSSKNPSVYLPLVLSALSACADPVIVDPIPDGGTNPSDMPDGGTNSTLPKYGASAGSDTNLFSETTLNADPNRCLKRDPHYMRDGQTAYLFISGTTSQAGTQPWSVSYFVDGVGSQIKTNTPWKLALAPRTGSWLSKDVTAPFARKNTSDWSLYFAASGDSTKPDYVLQIGRATATAPDQGWTPDPQPALPTPAFNGGTPMTVRQDAWGVTDPWLMTESGGVTMYYAGLDCSATPCQFRIFRTVSTDNGLTFPPGSVVLSGRSGVAEEAGGVAGPSVLVQDGVYLLAYTSVKDAPMPTRDSIRQALTTGTVGLAVSMDGKNFQPGTKDGVPLVPRLPGQNFRGTGTGSPSLYLDTTVIRGFYTGLLIDSGTGYYSIGEMTVTKSL